MPPTQSFSLPMAGGCRCGQLRYHVHAMPRFTFACHCTDCQQLSASAFSMGMAVEAAGFIAQGETNMWEKTAESGGWSRQFSCPRCATWTHTMTEKAANIVIVRPSTLQDHGWVRPVAEIFTRSALPWARLAVPLSYETEFEDSSALAAVFAASQIAPSG